VFTLLQPRNKYLFIEACYSGSIIDRMITWSEEDRFPGFLNLQVVTAAAADRLATPIVFTAALLRNLVDWEPISIEDWVLALHTDARVVVEANILLRGHPQHQVFTAEDQDWDGLADNLEVIYRTDYEDPDSDDDEVCDSIEQLPYLPIGSGNRGLLDAGAAIPWEHQQRVPVGVFDAHWPYLPTKLPQGPIMARNHGSPPVGYTLTGAEIPYRFPIRLEPDRHHGSDITMKVVTGSLPPGLSIDPNPLAIAGAPTEAGTWDFTVELEDERGAFTQSELSISVEEKDLTDGNGVIQITRCELEEVHTPDDDITIGEALLLARGDLVPAQLQPYVSEEELGERRLVTGEVGLAWRDTLATDGCFNHSTGNISITSPGDIIGFSIIGEVWIRAPEVQYQAPWASHPGGTAIVIDEGVWGVTVATNFRDSLHGIRIHGHDNTVEIGGFPNTSEGPPYNITGDVVEISGENAHGNRINRWGWDEATPGVAGQASGILIAEGAHHNEINANVYHVAGDGILLRAAGPGNKIGVGEYTAGATSVGGDGLEIKDTPGTLVEWASLSRSAGFNIRLTGADTQRTRIVNTTVTCLGEGLGGIIVENGASQNTIITTRIEGNEGSSCPVGLVVDGAHANRFDNLRFWHTTSIGVQYRNGAHDNLFVNTDPYGIQLSQGDGFVLQGEGVTNNTFRGIVVTAGGDIGVALALSEGAHHNRFHGAALGGWGANIGVSFNSSCHHNSIEDSQIGGLGQSNAAGVEFVGGAHHNQLIGCDVIENGGTAVRLAGDDTANNEIAHSTIRIDEIVVDPDTHPRYHGVVFEDNTHHNVLVGSRIGGFADSQIVLRDGAHHNLLLAVHVTETSAGFGDVNLNGVLIDDAHHNRVGDCSGLLGPNIIHQNHGAGVRISGANAHHNVVCHSEIGTDGDLDQDEGVVLLDGAHHNRIGGMNPLVFEETGLGLGASGNVIYGHMRGTGIVITGPGTDENHVYGNIIGFHPRSERISSHWVGIRIDAGARNNRLGHRVADLQKSPLWANTIQSNGWHGVEIDGAATVGNVLYGNQIRYNSSGLPEMQVGLSNGAHDGLGQPTLTRADGDRITISANWTALVQMYAWGPGETAQPVLVYSGYPRGRAIDLDTLNGRHLDSLPDDWSLIDVTADQTDSQDGTSGLSAFP